MATHSSILARRIPWTEEPGGLQCTGSQRVGEGWVINTFTKTGACFIQVLVLLYILWPSAHLILSLNFFFWLSLPILCFCCFNYLTPSLQSRVWILLTPSRLIYPCSERLGSYSTFLGTNLQLILLFQDCLSPLSTSSVHTVKREARRDIRLSFFPPFIPCGTFLSFHWFEKQNPVIYVG